MSVKVKEEYFAINSYEKRIEKLKMYSRENYLLNQADCILNLDANNNNDHRKVSELFSTYGKILQDYTSPEFRKSMEISKNCIEESIRRGNDVYDDKIMDLKINNPQSFLIIPICTNNHLFCSLVRKNDDGISSTLINASSGGRRGDDRGTHVAYEEYIFKMDNIGKFVQILYKVNMHLNFRISNYKVYDLFENKADEKHALNVFSRDQKDGNCYVKEPEKAIKYAIATSDFSQKKLRSLRYLNKDYFKPKWPIATKEVHRRYIAWLIAGNPQLKDELSSRFSKYLEYKNFGKEDMSAKMLVSGQSSEKNDEMIFQDNRGKLIGIAEKYRNSPWIYRDMKGNFIGGAMENGNKTEYMDKKGGDLGYSIRYDIGQKFFDKDGKLVGIGRYYHGMFERTGKISQELKGIHPLNLMLRKENVHEKLPRTKPLEKKPIDRNEREI